MEGKKRGGGQENIKKKDTRRMPFVSFQTFRRGVDAKRKKKSGTKMSLKKGESGKEGETRGGGSLAVAYTIYLDINMTDIQTHSRTLKVALLEEN